MRPSEESRGPALGVCTPKPAKAMDVDSVDSDDSEDEPIKTKTRGAGKCKATVHFKPDEPQSNKKPKTAENPKIAAKLLKASMQSSSSALDGFTFVITGATEERPRDEVSDSDSLRMSR